MANGSSVTLNKSELNKIKKAFEKERVKRDFYTKHNVDAGCIIRLLETGRCSTKTYNKLLKKP